MKYYSTNNKEVRKTFREALWEGLAEDGGLYCPAFIPLKSTEQLNELIQSDRIELATEVLLPFMEGEIDRPTLANILNSAINFPIPLRRISENRSVLELFHGPTEAFKDVGARFMSRIMSHFLGNQKLTILVATSGDTGSAVADGFWNVDGIDVIVLFPKNGVSTYQELQMTTLGNNITAVEVEGSFDDCQDLVKRAFGDKKLNASINLSSANSINIGRLLPQMLYYFFLAQQIEEKERSGVNICVPSGNFGNLTSGLYANQMGLKYSSFFAATNANRTFPDYLESGVYRPRKSITTYSNAMDVGKPSNFDRILELFNSDRLAMQQKIKSTFVSDEETLQVMKRVYVDYNYLLDPHAAVGWASVERMSLAKEEPCIVLGTAHPRKFERAVQKALPGLELDYPKNDRQANKLTLKNKYEKLKELVINY